MGKWRNGVLECWSVGEMEGWKNGKMEKWKDGKMENVNIGEMEYWSIVVLGLWMDGKRNCEKMERLERTEQWRIENHNSVNYHHSQKLSQIQSRMILRLNNPNICLSENSKPVVQG